MNLNCLFCEKPLEKHKSLNSNSSHSEIDYYLIYKCQDSLKDSQGSHNHFLVNSNNQIVLYDIDIICQSTNNKYNIRSLSKDYAYDFTRLTKLNGEKIFPIYLDNLKANCQEVLQKLILLTAFQ
jgi:hypothetical protein